jgi:2,3-bisphosphoglycerate-dependent phosphoglycerate mutase
MVRDYQRPFGLPEGAVELVLVRHGSSVWSDDDGGGVALTGGQHDPPISLEGRRQARAVALRLSEETLTAVFVTPLRRTAETARPLAAMLGREPVVVSDLRDVYLGEWEGEWNVRMARRDPLAADIFAAERWDVIPNAEPMEDFADRIHRGMEEVAVAIGPDSSGVAFLHAGVIAEICRQSTGSTGFAFLYAENCSISRVLRLASGRWALRSFNDVSHLRTGKNARSQAELDPRP